MCVRFVIVKFNLTMARKLSCRNNINYINEFGLILILSEFVSHFWASMQFVSYIHTYINTHPPWFVYARMHTYIHDTNIHIHTCILFLVLHLLTWLWSFHCHAYNCKQFWSFPIRVTEIHLFFFPLINITNIMANWTIVFEGLSFQVSLLW